MTTSSDTSKPQATTHDPDRVDGDANHEPGSRLTQRQDANQQSTENAESPAKPDKPART